MTLNLPFKAFTASNPSFSFIPSPPPAAAMTYVMIIMMFLL